jgi:hypothetical protein
MESVASFTPRPLYLREKTPFAYLVGSWVGPRTDPDILEEKISFATSSRNGTKDSSFRSLITSIRNVKEYEFEKSAWN